MQNHSDFLFTYFVTLFKLDRVLLVSEFILVRNNIAVML